MNDDIFEVGLPISIETDYKSYLTTRIVGWDHHLFFMSGIVQSGSKSPPLKVNDHCKMRFLRDGVAYGFETKVMAIHFHPFPVMFFKYPTAIEKITIRKFNRIKSNFPARLLDKDGNFIADTVITDISAGGCGLSISSPNGKELSGEKIYQIAFSILETDMHLRCAIKKMRTGKNSRLLGVEFIDTTANEKEKINLFLEICANIFTSKFDTILARMKTAGETLGGHIDDLPLTDMLQIFDQMKKEGVLNISSGEHRGTITLSSGQMMDASFDDFTGEDALVELLSLKDGDFHFYTKPISTGFINRPINFILMDTCRLLDERESIKDHLPTHDEHLTLLNDPKIEDHEVQAVVSALQNGVNTISSIKAATGLSLIRSSLLAARLIKDGFVARSGQPLS